MVLHVHRAERTDTLAAGLATLLSAPPADPFTRDLVSVPTPGIERFLAQSLGRVLGASAGRADGVCANVDFPSPAALVDEVLAAAPDSPARVWHEDPWRPARAVWPLLATIDESAGEAWCAPLARHLGLDGSPRDRWDRTGRRFATAARLAALFHGYASQRPAMILRWAAGPDTDGPDTDGPDANGLDEDGTGHSLDADQAWQPHLWRRLRARIGSPSPAERLESAARAIEADPAACDLPARLSVFGPSRLPADQLRVLTALARGRDVHLWLADASPALWDRVPAIAPGTGRVAEPTAGAVRHPLLRSLGRDARELAGRLSGLVDPADDEHLPDLTAPDSTAARASGSESGPPRTLLARLHADLRADRPPQAEPADPLDPRDQSIQVHGCHGPARQAEILREAILTLLADDPTLQPRDILVMCPDLRTFAPLLAATFAATGPGTPLADLRVRIADRSPEQDNEVLATLGAALDLIEGRALRSELLDLVARAPVRTRYRLSEDDLVRLDRLSVGVGARWGLDSATRSTYGLPGIDAGTWQWAVDRLLLGVALSEDELPVVAGLLPHDDVGNSDVELVGRLAEIVARLTVLRDACRDRKPLAAWIDVLSEAVTGLTDARGEDSWQLPHALAALAGLAHFASTAGSGADADDRSEAGPELSLPDVRWLLADLLAGRPTRSNFRSGGLTVCGLLPMRSVPHRVICLVGMDDGAFPRTPVPDGDDVLARRPCAGERDTRSEDRQVLLDAIMAATGHLVITYTAADDRTNADCPPCVPLGELLDSLDLTAVPGTGQRVRDQILHKHPLQPFDVRGFRSAGAWGRPFSHDRAALAAAEASLLPRHPRPGLEPTAPLPELLPDVVDLEELTKFLVAPAQWFLRTRIGVRPGRTEELAPESIPVELDGLARWALGDRILGLAGRHHPVPAIARAEKARGALPPGVLGDEVLTATGDRAVAIAGAIRHAQEVAAPDAASARLVPVSILLPSQRRIIGSIGQVYGDALVVGSYSHPGAKALLRAWPALLALAASDPNRSVRAVLIGGDKVEHLAAPPAAASAELLDELVDLMAAGSRSPLPVYAKTSYAYALRRREGRSPEAALGLADRDWRSGRFPGECDAPEAVAVFGEGASIELLIAAPPLPGEAWWPDEPRRFGQLSRRLWDPILQAMARGAEQEVADRRATRGTEGAEAKS